MGDYYEMKTIVKKDLLIENKIRKISIHLPESCIEQECRWDIIRDELINRYKKNAYWIFRGQHNWDYFLQTTIERRKIDMGRRKMFYSDLITLFQGAMHQYSGIEYIPKRDEILETQALMQHYGCPTAFLDWTFSPYIAAYFATNDANINNDKDASIYALNLVPLQRIVGKYFMEKGIIDKEFDIHSCNEPKIFKKIVKHPLSSDEAFILAVSPRRQNNRIYFQQGYFTINGNLYYGFEESLAIILMYGINEKIILGEEIKEILIKIKVPQKEKLKVQEDLLLMNITSATLFPGLDGYSKALEQYIIKKNNKLDAFFKEVDKKRSSDFS